MTCCYSTHVSQANQTGAQTVVQDILPAAVAFLSDKSVYVKHHAVSCWLTRWSRLCLTHGSFCVQVGNTAQQLKTAVAQMIAIELDRSEEVTQKIFPWLRSREAPIQWGLIQLPGVHFYFILSAVVIRLRLSTIWWHWIGCCWGRLHTVHQHIQSSIAEMLSHSERKRPRL